MQCHLKSLPRRGGSAEDCWIHRNDETHPPYVTVGVQVHTYGRFGARSTTTTAATATGWRGGERKMGRGTRSVNGRACEAKATKRGIGGRARAELAIWIIYWTVSLDTGSQSRRDILTPRLLLAVRSPPSPFATGRPLTPGLSTFPVNPATVVGSANLKNVFSFPLLLPPASAATSSAKRQPLLPCLLYPIPAIRPRAKLSNKFPRQIHRSSFLLFLFFFIPFCRVPFEFLFVSSRVGYGTEWNNKLRFDVRILQN